jgi:hypothetical protein
MLIFVLANWKAVITHYYVLRLRSGKATLVGVIEKDDYVSLRGAVEAYLRTETGRSAFLRALLQEWEEHLKLKVRATGLNKAVVFYDRSGQLCDNVRCEGEGAAASWGGNFKPSANACRMSKYLVQLATYSTILEEYPDLEIQVLCGKELIERYSIYEGLGEGVSLYMNEPVSREEVVGCGVVLRRVRRGTP